MLDPTQHVYHGHEDEGGEEQGAPGAVDDALVQMEPDVVASLAVQWADRDSDV